MQDLNKFMKKVVKQPDGCWLWSGANNYKYGHFTLGNEIYAHRSSYILHGNEIPEGMLVLHKCDVPLCVNPNHLFLGTHAENMQDKVKKNRQSRGTKKMEKMPTPLNTYAIIKLLGGPTRISKLVGVSVPAVSMWQNGDIPMDKMVILAATLEKESHGLITRKALFPNNYKIIWPELE
jgi:DNA-binding transcriptional regulator YdaS (Cro superfamily)